MTVNSLWAALDEAGSGVPVGIDEFNLRGHGDKPENQTVLAVDLSIWICEGFASTALSSFHSDPAVHLVYQRTCKLISLGLGLIFVVEGQRRVRSTTTVGEAHELKQRRSGSQFWNASKRCEAVLELLGVPVVRAEAEGEALCALLNMKGIVDGVISNDGDCLLFGATTVYTGFTAENLEARKVIRYDADKLVAKLESGSSRTIKLSREDCVAFAALAGSDLVGNAINFVGHRKAIQFLRACKSLKHPHHDRTCLDELLSWSDEGPIGTRDVCIDCDDDGPSTITSRSCSLCLHPGDKKQHEKNGCAECRTSPGEGCFVVTSNEKFLRSLKEKAIGTIAPRHIVEGYFLPNSNHVPAPLLSLETKPYAVTMTSENCEKLFKIEYILKGRSRESSRDFLLQTLPKLMARLDLLDSSSPRNMYVSGQPYKPSPVAIQKMATKQSKPCYEIMWSIKVHSSEVPLQFTTVESQALVNSRCRDLVEQFQRDERRKQQGRAEDERRKHFVGIENNPQRRHNQCQRRDFSKKTQQMGHRRKRERHFDAGRVKKIRKATAGQERSNDVAMLMANLPSDEPIGDAQKFDFKEEDGESNVHDPRYISHSPQKDTANANSDSEDHEELEDDIDCVGHNLGYRGLAPVICGQEACEDYARTDGNTNEDSLYNDHHGGSYHHLPSEQAQHRHLEDVSPTRQLPMRQDGASSKQMSFGDSAHCNTHTPTQQYPEEQGLTPRTRMYCDMGIQIEVTPITSRRWRFL